MYRFFLAVMLCLLGVQAAAVQAQTRLVFEGCTDALGHAVPSLSDPSLPQAFATQRTAGALSIHYNPVVPAGLSERARLFFYAHECARIGLGQETGLRNVGDAWRADCRALETLLHSGLLRRQDIAALEAELQLPAALWSQLPGPPREIRLTACADASSRGRLALPAAPDAGLNRWNACVQACGDTLLHCQRRTCGGLDCPACLPANDRCVAACEGAAQP